MTTKETKPVEEQALPAQEEHVATPPPPEETPDAEKSENGVPAEESKETTQAKPAVPWELLTDGTSVIEIQIISDKDQGQLLGDPALLKKIDEFLKRGKG
jgi:hypothetical protein